VDLSSFCGILSWEPGGLWHGDWSGSCGVPVNDLNEAYK